jgi:hypothetical protein
VITVLILKSDQGPAVGTEATIMPCGARAGPVGATLIKFIPPG